MGFPDTPSAVAAAAYLEQNGVPSRVEAGSPNAIPVIVELLDFLGAFCRATLRPSAARDLIVRSDFSANAVRDLGITEGQTLTIGLPPESLRVFDADAAGSA